MYDVSRLFINYKLQSLTPANIKNFNDAENFYSLLLDSMIVKHKITVILYNQKINLLKLKIFKRNDILLLK